MTADVVRRPSPAGAPVVELAAWRTCVRGDRRHPGALAVDRLRDGDGNVVVRSRLSLDAARADPDLSRMLDVWSAGCRKGPPAFADLDPVRARDSGLPDRLSIVAVADSDPAEYRYTYAGPGLTARFAYDLTGLRLIDLPGAALVRALAEDYVAARQSGLPRFQEVAFVLGDRVHGYRRLILPCTDGGRSIARLVVAVVPADFPVA